MAPISVTIEREHPPVGTVTLTGEHDAYSAGRIANEIEVILDAGMPVVIDLSDATFVDSAIVTAIVRHARTPSESTVLVAPPGTTPRHTFDLIALDSTVPVCDTRDHALRLLGR